MYEIMINNTSEASSVNFPAFEKNAVVRSCLASVIISKEWDIANKLLNQGAVVNTTEIGILMDVY